MKFQSTFKKMLRWGLASIGATIMMTASQAQTTWTSGPSVYKIFAYNKDRVFNFDGDQPFLSQSTGGVDVATMQFNGLTLTESQIRVLADPHVSKVNDPLIGNQQVTKIMLSPSDAKTAGSWRTQINSYQVAPLKTYLLELEFRLDDSWDFYGGRGLLWQLKGQPQDYQWGNPVVAFNLDGTKLSLNILYPSTTDAMTTWGGPVAWTSNQYIPVTIPTQTISDTKYHSIRVLMYADDRPQRFGGRGYFTVWFDGQPWYQYVGPTLHPDQKDLHNTSFGWYQYSGQPTTNRVLYYRTNHMLAWQ